MPRAFSSDSGTGSVECMLRPFPVQHKYSEMNSEAIGIGAHLVLDDRVDLASNKVPIWNSSLRDVESRTNDFIVGMSKYLQCVRVGTGIELHEEHRSVLEELHRKGSNRQTRKRVQGVPHLHGDLGSVDGIVLGLGLDGDDGQRASVSPRRYEGDMNIVDLSLTNSRDAAPHMTLHVVGRRAQEMRDEVVVTKDAQEPLLVHRPKVLAKKALNRWWSSIHYLDDRALDRSDIVNERRLAHGKRVNATTRDFEDPKAVLLNLRWKDGAGFHPVDDVGSIASLQPEPDQFLANLLESEDDLRHASLELASKYREQYGPVHLAAESMRLNRPHHGNP